MSLRFFGTEPTSVFALLGKDENSATFALGWTLDRCPSFRELFLADLLGSSQQRTNDVLIDLQRHEEAGGFTDIEIVSDNVCHFIVEAKRGWTVPSREQLEMYVRRMSKHSKGASQIVSLSAATREYAVRRLGKKISDMPVTHRSWADVKRLAAAARLKASGYEERLWLDQLDRHLEDYVSMQNPRDNLVYVVSLSGEPIRDGDAYTWVDVVEKDARYFHPLRKHWPVEPPNYIGFRHHGELQSVHHIDGHEVVSDLTKANPKWPADESDHFVYSLGPPMKPARRLPNGKIYPSGRIWCAIDTLLSGVSETISDARDETKRRLKVLPPGQT